jgi:hypothetical protein
MTYEDYVEQGRHYTFLDKRVAPRSQERYPHWLVLDDRMLHQPTQIEVLLQGVGKEDRPDEADRILCFHTLKNKVRKANG